jgi:hypothetical protein
MPLLRNQWLVPVLLLAVMGAAWGGSGESKELLFKYQTYDPLRATSQADPAFLTSISAGEAAI